MSEPKWIEFVSAVPGPKRKTNRWCVFTKDFRSSLGQVKWCGRWRCYAFYPDPQTLYEKQCLRDIAQFCEDKTREYKERNKKGS